jgi:succinyl-diaminopimelate desuccinylase
MTQEQIIEQAKKFLTIPSTVDNSVALHAAVDFIAAHIRNYEGITIERFEKNGVPSLLAYAGERRPELFDVLLNAHVDVVPGAAADFEPFIRDGKLYGRGAYDMKLAALIMTDVFCQVAATSPSSIGLQIVADEEVGGYNGVRHQLDNGVRAKFAIAGEMTDLDICYESRGICWTEIKFSGVKAHGGHAWHGENAITKATAFTQALLERYPMPAKPTWTTTANISSINTSNTTFNLVPEEATLKVDFRFTPENHDFTNKHTVTELVKSIDATAEIVAFPVYEPAVYVPHENESLQKLMRALHEATGENAALIQRHGSSDARHFASEGIPCVEFGLSGGGLHADGEYANLDSVPKYRATLETFLYDYNTNTTRATRGHSNSHGAALRK